MSRKQWESDRMIEDTLVRVTLHEEANLLNLSCSKSQQTHRGSDICIGCV